MAIINTIIKLLFFKLSREEMLNFNNKHLVAGIIGTWLVGIGRYWDDPGASLLQHLGLGSVVYIFVLAAIIWLILRPFRVEYWTYSTVLIFISLTSFPAIFYAIPVEKFFSIEMSNSINVWFLAVVAAWRLALLFYFILRFSQLNLGTIITVTLLPITVIISTLTILNLHRVVFDLMGGVRNNSPHDASYAVLVFLTVVSLALTIPLLLAYGIGLYLRLKQLKSKDKES